MSDSLVKSTRFSLDDLHISTTDALKPLHKQLDDTIYRDRIPKAARLYAIEKEKGRIQRVGLEHRPGCIRDSHCSCPRSLGLEPVNIPLFSDKPTCTGYCGPEVTDMDLDEPVIPLVPKAGRIDFATKFKKITRFYQEQAVKKAKNQIIRPRCDVAFDDEGEDGCSAGAMRDSLVQRVLNQMGYTRSPDQAMFHDAFRKACLPHIYGRLDWDSIAPNVLDELTIQRIQYEVLIQTPRRFGKTVSVAMMIAALLYSVPGIKICVFSTGQRASGSLMDLVVNLLCKLPGGEKRIVSQNQEQLFVAMNELPDGTSGQSAGAKKLKTDDKTSKLFSYPSTVTGKCFTHIYIIMHADRSNIGNR